MSDYAIVQTGLDDSREAGSSLGADIRKALGNHSPDAVILFASPRYDFPQLLAAIDAACRPGALVGCSSAGEFTSTTRGEGLVCALAIRSSEMRFTVGCGRGISSDFASAARDLVAPFQGMSSRAHGFRSALVLTDALAGHAENLVDSLTVLTGGAYQFFGGGAGDDARFGRTYVFCGTEAISDGAVGLEILSDKPLGIGVRHGWKPASAPLRVTEADGMRLISLNAISAVEVFEEHAEATGQRFEAADPLPFFLHNILGIETGAGHKLRVPLSVNSDGSVSCAAEVPVGATVHLMKTDRSSEAGSIATRSGIEGLGSNPPQVAIVFDCVASRLRMGSEYASELEQIAQALAPATYVGCNTYGQIARAEGQFGGFHNCTAVVCVFPD